MSGSGPNAAVPASTACRPARGCPGDMELRHHARVLQPQPLIRGALRHEGAMSTLNIRIGLIVLAMLLSAAGYAAAKGGGHGGGGHGGGHHGGGHHGGGHHGGGHGGRHFGGGGHHGGHFGGRAHFGGGGRHAVHNMRSGAVRNAMNSRALSRTLRNTAALRNPNIRARGAAGAAMAGWYYGRTGSGWWQHSNGGD